ncbi:DoxX family protein [Runella rosea]|uniref:DoxX family protein n=2 Tax=Runella TaxID=105 RepID=A0A344TNZ5_9BACT|nr:MULTISPECIES: DoxX family protein [Runella]AXE20366.1 DoxX family protein [Runella rosea]MCP1383880.1 DoxX family protein [Runella salmonicolor]
MKRDKIIYWITTGLIALLFLFSSYMYLTKAPDLIQSFQKIGFPIYFVTMLGIFKLLGSLALLNPWFDSLKEWAYAGFAFTLIGATWTHIATGTPFIMPIVILGVLGVSYFFKQKLQAKLA